jgi:hypothetical protein
MVQLTNAIYQNEFVKLKFRVVPFFSILEEDVEIDLQLSAFVQMFTYILYCPDIAQCPWLQQMIPTNNTNCKFLMHKILSNVECLVLLHSPIIINLEKLGTINKEVNGDKMDNDFTTQEIKDYFSSSEFVSGCIFKKEHNSFTWIHEIELNGLYEKFGGLMNFLSDCALDKVNAKMSLYDYSIKELADNLPDIECMVLKSTRTSLNTEIADVAKALHGEKTAFLKAKVSHNFEVHFETIENLWKDHYLISEINLMHQEDGTLDANKIVKFEGNGTSRRSCPMYKSAAEV